MRTPREYYVAGSCGRSRLTSGIEPRATLLGEEAAWVRVGRLQSVSGAGARASNLGLLM